jgi:hypothetical protein
MFIDRYTVALEIGRLLQISPHRVYSFPSSVVPIIPLSGINLAGFPSENGRESTPYKTEKALVSEPILTLLPTGI